MFGNYTRSLDQKKRVSVPFRFSQELGSIIYATFGPDQVLELRDAKSFSIWKKTLLSNNMLNPDARKFIRILFGNTAELNVDFQGRITLPDFLLTKANITKEVTFVGVGNKVELWPTASYSDFQEAQTNENTLDKLAQKLWKDGGNY